ncbi:MAG: MBL fold metallo-hydrolase [Firmicutes bacterium]|nr:MBL fold metallo-hydrolase [Bacillota bacterium]
MKIERFIGGLLDSNGYVISAKESGDYCYIIDPGYNPKRYLEYLEEKDLQLKGIILTHHHSDHVGGAWRIHQETDAPIFLHINDADKYDYPVDEYLEEGDRLPLSNWETLLVLHTPGHTQGSVCLMAERSKVCFTGDTIFNVDLGRTDLEDGSERAMNRSCKYVVNAWPNEVTIYPGHGDPATMKEVRKINREFLDIIEG